MPYYDSRVDEGFNASVTRLQVQVDDHLHEVLVAAHGMAVDALERFEQQSRPLDDPGVNMFAEWVAAAAIVRSAHGEPPLERDDIDAFLPYAVKFLNTLFCPPPT
jgi:hypothetical protein